MRSMVEGAMRALRKTIERAKQLRRELSLPEVLLWQTLRRSQIEGLRFRRQHPIGPSILDFYCASHRLAVEIDGAAHDGVESARHDAARDLWLWGQGIAVLRFPALDVLDTDRRRDVLATIAAAVAPSTAFGGPPPPRRG